jgi:hypothetical protein
VTSMTVFISHSFENKPEFDNIADAFEQKGIEYWKPGSLTAGSSLADQLRQSIVEADLCVFVATRHSIASAWCGAELGAFWGAGKPVIIYVAEASLSEDEMPKQFRGHLVERRISRVVEAVVARLGQREEAEQAQDRSPDVGSMTVESLKQLIAEVLSRAQDAAFVQTTLARVAQLLRVELIDNPVERELRELMTGLLGVLGVAVREGAKRTSDWKHTFAFTTDTGEWMGLAQSYDPHTDYRAPISFYRHCMVWRAGAGQHLEAVALVDSVTDHDEHGIVAASDPLVVVGRGVIGKIQWERPDQRRPD